MAQARIWGFGKRQAVAVERAAPPAAIPLIRPKQDPIATPAQAAEALLLMRNFEESRQGWFWSTDAEGRILFISETLAQTIGQEQGSPLGARFADIFVQADEDSTGRRPLPFVLARQRPFEKVAVCAASGSDERCWSISGSPQHDAAGKFIGYRGSAIDVTDQRISSQQASQLAKYDALTGLPNRRRMAEVLDANLAGDAQGAACAVILIDLDRFKQVNDTLGHPAGDALLKQVADRLSRIVGDRERVFRLGGDEFQIILPKCQDRGIIGDLAADIITSLSQPYSVEGSRCTIGASIGIALSPVDGASRADLIRNADLALYASKSGGRGRFRFFSAELLRAAEDKRALEEELRDALAKGQMRVAYQPVVSATSNRITGFEALIRWDHPERGPVSPAVFIPLAEEAGLVAQIGEWVLRSACDAAAKWPSSVRIAVNVSPIQFTNEAFPAIVMSALAASGLAPERLELEITEGVFLSESLATDEMFAALKAIGVRLALDDFGTGYSSLGYLRTAPFDKIKIDQTFVREATLAGSRNSAIIAAIVALADALGMETTAEGVEYMDQLDLVRGLRVSHIQGWVYGKAISSEEVVERLNADDWRINPSGPARQRSDRQSMYRKVGVIYGSRYTSAIMRNLSGTGALLEACIDIPAESLIVVDFGDGQLTFARVCRVHGGQYGIAFEQELVDDGNGGLCTSHRVSPYLLSSVGLPSPGDPDKSMSEEENPAALEELASRLGLTLAPRPQWTAAGGPQPASAFPGAAPKAPTFRELSERYLETIQGDEPGRESARRDLRNHILPRFGQLRLDQVADSDILAWLAAKVEVDEYPAGTDGRLKTLLSRIWSFAVELNLPGAETNPLDGVIRFDRRGRTASDLDVDQAARLLAAAKGSRNPQLPYILSLLMLTGARPGELLAAQWSDFDLASGVWQLAAAGSAKCPELRLSKPALALIARLKRWSDCPYLVPNPATLRPYQSITGSWNAAKTAADLGHLDIDDLRYCDLGAQAWEEHLLATVIEAEPAAEEPDGIGTATVDAIGACSS